MTNVEIVKAVADAVEILRAARLNNSDVVHVPVIFIPIMHAEEHIQAEIKAMFRA